MVKLDLQLTAEEALVACRERGVVVRSERELVGRRRTWTSAALDRVF